jgi:hypothetical protein
MGNLLTTRAGRSLAGLLFYCGASAAVTARAATIPDTPAPGSCRFSAGWMSPTRIEHYQFDPIVVSPRIADTVALKVAAPPSVDSVVLELAAGGTLTLAPSGANLFCGLLMPRQVLFGYQPDDVQRNFVGYLNLNAGATRLKRLNLFIDVADDAVPIVPPDRLADDMQATAHVVNVVTSGLPERLDSQGLAQRFYAAYADTYDFLNVVSTPAYTGNRHHVPVRNDVAGIGLGLFDDSARFGSAGRLQGLSRFPITSLFDLAERGNIHEMGHQWMAYIGGAPELSPGHWPPSTLANGIMGFSIGAVGGEGGTFPFRVVPIGGGYYRLDPGGAIDAFNDMELYLMGLAPASQVGPHVLLENKPPCVGCVYKGTTLTVQTVVAANGARVPAWPDAPNHFTMATIVASMDRLLTPREMSFFEYFAARGEATVPVPYSSGFAKGMTKPFAVATGGRGTLSTTLGARR